LSGYSGTVVAMTKKREPIDDLIDAHVWMRRQEVRLNRRLPTLDGVPDEPHVDNRPETLIRWHRAGFRLFWKWKSRSGRPPIPLELRQLIRRMAKENPLWGQERIANELWLKLGLRVSPRTVRKYLPRAPAGCPRGDQRWSTFLKNHAQSIVACDFFVTVTCGLRLLYVLVVMEHGSRRLIHCNVTAHPTAVWTRQQLREALGYETRYRYRYLIHDRDSIFSWELDNSVESLGVTRAKENRLLVACTAQPATFSARTA